MYSRDGRKLSFSYDGNMLLKEFVEIGHNIVPYPSEASHLAIESRSEIFPFDDEPDEVTEENIKRIFETSEAVARTELRLIASGDKDESSILGTVVISVSDSLAYLEGDIRAVDSFIHNILIYGALVEWFREKGVKAIFDDVSASASAFTAEIKPVVRNMVQAKNRKPLRNPFV